MKKILKPFVLIAVLTIFLSSLHSLLMYQPFDSWVTSKFVDIEEKNNIISTNRSEGVYSLNETDLPCVYADDEKLYMVIGDVTADITPEDINMMYYSKVTNFNDMIRQKENYLLSEDGRYILYRLIFKGNPYLYLFDVENERNIFISDRVESFDLYENEQNDATVIFATGYDNSNKLFAFSYNSEKYDESKCFLIADDIDNAGVFEEYNCVVYLDKKENLYKYNIDNGDNDKISASVEEIYYPEENKYNYVDYYNMFTVCAKIGGKDYILNGNEKIEIKGGYYNVIPKYVYKNDSDTTYYYSAINKKIIMCLDGSDNIIYDELGELYHVFGYYKYENSEGGCFVVATEEYLYLLKDDGSKAEELMPLPDEYIGFTNMLENHMDVYMVADDVFYVNCLCDGSLIINNNNSESWLSGIESYNYGLVAVYRTDEGFEFSATDVPSSRIMSKPFAESKDNKNEFLYVSYFDDMTVKAISLINRNGQVVLADILGTSDLAKGQARIDILPCKSGVYFLYEDVNDNISFYKFDAEKLCLYHVEDENGIFTENYDEFNGVVSFGTLVIF